MNRYILSYKKLFIHTNLHIYNIYNIHVFFSSKVRTCTVSYSIKGIYLNETTTTGDSNFVTTNQVVS